MSRSSQLSREKIAAAALVLADAEGFASVSMRRIAQQLGVGTMSLYYYVRTKADLIAAMDDALMGEVLMPSLPRNWREALTGIAIRTRDVFLRHPWALSSMLSAPPGVNAMRHMEQCLQALTRTTMTTREKLALLAIIDDFVFGYTLRETASDSKVDPEFARAQFATEAFPRLKDAFGKGRRPAMPDRFQVGLRALLSLVKDSSE
ncbi:MAG: TetR/AcrR family transcriptional regulator [Terriglobales bacterium]|jgi:AcrR family transcriptional regulator